jgi:flagellar motor component MotA
MKSLLTITGVLVFLAALAAGLYGCYLALGSLWNLYMELDAVIRLVLLSSIATLLIAATIIGGSIKKAVSVNNKGQLVKAKLELYKPVIQSYQQYIKAIYPLTQQVQTESLAKLNDLDIEMMVLASSPVMDAHHKLHNALGSHQDENLALLLQQLIKAMRRDLGHGVDYGKSRQEFLGAAEPAGNAQHPSHGIN